MNDQEKLRSKPLDSRSDYSLCCFCVLSAYNGRGVSGANEGVESSGEQEEYRKQIMKVSDIIINAL